MSPQETMRKIDQATHAQVLKCKCGKIFAACLHGFQDAEWDKEVRKYREMGYTDEILPKGSYIMEPCECKKKEEVFVNPNQTSLF